MAYNLVRPFDIDDGQLDGKSLQECFVLGYELAEIDALLKLPAEIQKPVHADNRERIERWCKDSGRPFRIWWSECDRSETWMMLAVAPMEAQ